MSEEKSLAVHEPKAVSAFAGGAESFELGQRMARALAESDIVPTTYKGKLSNCMVALEVAHRTGSSVLAVMQNLHIIHGKPSWSAQYIIAAINSSGRYTPLRFEMKEDGTVSAGGKTVKNLVCSAIATDKKTGETLRGPAVSIATAVSEGWYGKQGSKWPAMPELMLQYRAGTFFGRLYCPEILLGMQSEDEIRDVTTTSSVGSINERIRARKAETIEVEPKAVAEVWPEGKQEIIPPEADPDHDNEGFY
jgi:hypothetical protein